MKNKYQNIRIKKILKKLVNTSFDDNSYLYGVIEGILLTYNYDDYDKFEYQYVTNTKKILGISLHSTIKETHSQYLLRKAKQLICHLDYLEK